jgi:hypothetical protein
MLTLKVERRRHTLGCEAEERRSPIQAPTRRSIDHAAENILRMQKAGAGGRLFAPVGVGLSLCPSDVERLDVFLAEFDGDRVDKILRVHIALFDAPFDFGIVDSKVQKIVEDLEVLGAVLA